MSAWPGRAGTAALLVAVGVIVPCAAWYVVGSRAARQQAFRLEAAPRELARREASRLAGQLGLRLDALLHSESRRPFAEYLSDDLLLEDDCSRELAFRSPLSQGPADPLIWAHFQIDDLGLLTLPSLGDTGRAPPGRDLDAPQVESLQIAILDELECASDEHLAALRRPHEPPAAGEPQPGSGAITVGPFSWHTITIKQQPALVAMREVATPRAVLTQGFVVLSESLAPLIAGGPSPASVRPGSPGAETEAPLAITGDSWTVVVDPASATAAAGIEAGRVLSRFHATFAIGALAALLAGGAIVLLVWRTDRLARERSRFAAAAAHELRTPLAGLQLHAEMLAGGKGDPARAADYARRISEEAQRLGRVVTNMLGLSRLEGGEPATRAEVGDLTAAVRDSVARLRPALEQRGATVRFDEDSAPLRARFDPDAVDRILRNLLDNAERYGRDATDRTIDVTLQPVGDARVLSVTDRGPGIDTATRRRLFRPFSRGAGDASPGGLGIGLALVRASARAQGATVEHHDVPGGGSSFSVRFRTH
jgi:signal transduction histidine kinase